MSARRCDWHKVLEDLAYLEMDVATIAARLRVPVALIEPLAGGARPSTYVREGLTRLWVHMTSKPEAFLPQMTPPTPLSKPVPRGEATEDQAQALGQVLSIWCRESGGSIRRQK